MQTLASMGPGPVTQLLKRYGMELVITADDAPIPGSHWGDEEAGLVGQQLYARSDTPLHSMLHEACHYVCMDPQRRQQLHTDAGGDYDEENAVCYLQILLADLLPDYGRHMTMREMDCWGYSFRLGSASAWFESDAEEARQWLIAHRLISTSGEVTFELRRAA